MVEKLTVEKPDFEEIKFRLSEHLKLRANGRDAALLWSGYIASLLEWGLLTVDEHARLSDLLPDDGTKDILYIFTGSDEVWDARQTQT